MRKQNEGKAKERNYTVYAEKAIKLNNGLFLTLQNCFNKDITRNWYDNM